jgi:hypothetical protein
MEFLTLRDSNSDLSVVQPVVSRYTDYTTAAPGQSPESHWFIDRSQCSIGPFCTLRLVRQIARTSAVYLSCIGLHASPEAFPTSPPPPPPHAVKPRKASDVPPY